MNMKPETADIYETRHESQKNRRQLVRKNPRYKHPFAKLYSLSMLRTIRLLPIHRAFIIKTAEDFNVLGVEVSFISRATQEDRTQGELVYPLPFRMDYASYRFVDKTDKQEVRFRLRENKLLEIQERVADYCEELAKRGIV